MFLRIIFFVLLMLPTLCRSSWAEPCGVRGYQGGTDGIVEIDCQTASDFANNPSSLHVRLPSGAIRGILLVDPTLVGGAANPAASKFRVRFNHAVNGPQLKAMAKIVAGISECEELQMIGYHTRYPANGPYELADTNCVGTDSNSDLYKSISCAAAATTKDSLWKCGYAARFPNGYKGVKQITADENATIAALSQAQLGAQGFKPLVFSGTFNGNSKRITGLTINRSTNSIGFFGSTSNATISGVGLVNCNVQGNTIVGGLVGDLVSSTLSNSYSTGSVQATSTTSTSAAGGLVGRNDIASSISTSYSTCDVNGGYDYVGGLVGENWGHITQCYSTGSANGHEGVGGLAGSNGRWGASVDAFIANCYSTSRATGYLSIGGLVGENMDPIANSYSASSYVSGGDYVTYVGGLVGGYYGGLITNSFSTSRIRPSQQGWWPVGGLIGNGNGALINCSWFKGDYSDPNGLPYSCPWSESCYRIAVANPSATSLAAVGKGTDSNAVANFYLKTYAVYQNSAAGGQPSNAWDFNSTWTEVANGLPRLRWQS